MELRVLTIEDKREIALLFRDIFTHEPWNDDWSDSAQLDAYIDDLVGQGNSLAFGYYAGDRLLALALGSVRHWYAGTEFHIDEFCVDRQAQGQGIGTAFLRAIEAFLPGKGIRRIFLLTDRHVPAYAFYLRNGFQVMPDMVSFVKEIGD